MASTRGPEPADCFSRVRAPLLVIILDVTDERDALRELTTDELAAVRRSVIRRLNRLDQSQSDSAFRAAALERAMELVGDEQECRHRVRHR